MRKSSIFLAAIALLWSSSAFAFTYDLMIVNGTVIDPSQSMHTVTRVAIKDGLVVAVGTSLDPNEACAVYDAAGKIVTPGLINIHTHFASAVWPKSGLGVDVDDMAKSRGYTTVVSAGDAGWVKAEKFKASSFATYDTRTYAFMYVARDGMAGKWPDNVIYSSECDGNALDVCTAGRIMAANSDFYLGVKTRMSDFIIDPLGLLPLTQAIAMADKAHDYNGRAYKVMVHVGALDTTTTIDTIVNLLRPGDIITHTYSAWLNKSGVPTGFAQNAACKPSAAQAVAKGIVLDLGASTGQTQVGAMFDPLSYVICAKTGIFPTTISGDEYSANSALYSMTDLASILLGLNNGSNVSPAWPPIAGPIPTPLTVDDVVRMMTTAPAAVIGDRGPANLGTLKIGAPGDVDVIDVQSGSFQFKVWQPGGSFLTVTSPTKLVVTKAFKGGVPIN